jgi:hypothetical protein
MGFLDHSTNNIIIDAVLTDKGRELLAKNNGTFRISHYSFGDDEVDYTIIKKFGRTVGKEKIEKNTPVFEAQTISNVGLRFPLTSYSDPTLVVLPYLEATTILDSITSTQSQESAISQKASSTLLTAEQKSLLEETAYQVHLDSRFLTLHNVGSTQPRQVPFSNIVIYDLNATAGAGATLSTLRLTFAQSPNGKSLTQFQTSGLVTTKVRVAGVSTGVSINFDVNVQY